MYIYVCACVCQTQSSDVSRIYDQMSRSKGHSSLQSCDVTCHVKEER